MAKDYIEYLSANLLNDGQTVSYRTLSRALRVHSNLAKQMLFEFHHAHSKTLHATYLITGTRTIVPDQVKSVQLESQDEADQTMQSSPVHDRPQLAPEYQATCLLLVDQDQLDNARSTFDQVLSIHIYSLQSGKLNDLHVLTECNRAIMAAATTTDYLDSSKQFGIIQNSQVKRRSMRAQRNLKQPSTTAPTKPMFASTRSAAQNDSKNTTTAKSTPESSQPSTQTSAKPAPTKTAPLKREGSSLFEAFAKAKPKPESSAEPSPAPESANLSDEDADEEDAAMLDHGAITETRGKSKKEREEELRRMMDMEDEPMPDATSKESASEAPEHAEDQPEASPAPQTKEEPQETVTISDGRRRGRRRVMKKKTVQDEEGYLVTREEPGWESFSEEEPAPKKAKVAVAPSAAKAKKAAPKGQGSIMSFFSKK